MPRTVRISSAAFTILLLTASSSLFADGPAKIRDNSFLIEEAYNQEYGVIQHVQTFQYMKDRSWGYSFTQEWPIPRETNQLSYTIPVDHTVGPSETGIGDVMLNYRYQLVLKEPLAIAPMFSLILPTGNSGKGLGNGVVGGILGELGRSSVADLALVTEFIESSSQVKGFFAFLPNGPALEKILARLK